MNINDLDETIEQQTEKILLGAATHRNGLLDIAKMFLNDRIGKVLILHMSSATDRNETFQIIGGIIDSVIFYENDEKYQDGFHIQLKSRSGKLYPSTEKFFGRFYQFEVIRHSFSDMLKVTYLDGSYFKIEVRI